MKYLISFFMLTITAGMAFGQLVNPTVICQDTDIALHHTDVYYSPFAPPSWGDTRTNLCCIASELHDPDGVRSYTYAPFSFSNTFGPNDVWMRLFTANDKPGIAHTHSNITAGGAYGDDVIVSALEDVDFRATGTIKMEAGFHVMPGAFFHAYIAPRFDTTVFSDEFDDTAKFQNQWAVWDSGSRTPNCSYNSNLALVTDTGAGDGHALRLDFWLDSCLCHNNFGGGPSEHCEFIVDTSHQQGVFSAANLKTCPFPFDSAGDPIRRAYANSPYGKYEVRDKIPNIKHHTNCYTGDQGNEYNIYETYSGNMTQIHPGISHNLTYGPYKGKFVKRTVFGLDSAFFQSTDAHFTLWNNPYTIIINNFPYEVALNIKPSFDTIDTLIAATATTFHEGGFPSTLIADTTDTVTFYYCRRQYGVSNSDMIAWSIDPTGHFFSYPSRDSAAYGIGKGNDTLYFNKAYQPTKIHFYDSVLVQDDTLPCHWDHTTGKIKLDGSIGSGSRNGNGFDYWTEEGPVYPVPPVSRDPSYMYHTYTMELLPHEAEFLIDGHVMRRFPDRLIPVGDIRYDYVTKYSRSPLHIEPAEIDFDGGTDLANEITSFQTYYSTPSRGGWDVNGHHAAHHLVDYVKVWDLPAGTKLPDFPR